MLANVRRLVERREAHASHSWDNPEAKLQSRATVRSGAAGVTLDGAESGGNPALSADPVAFCMRYARAPGSVWLMT
jgi:hypothetical protein